MDLCCYSCVLVVFPAIFGLPLHLETPAADEHLNPGSKEATNEGSLNMRAAEVDSNNQIVRLWPKGRVVYEVGPELKKDAKYIRQIDEACEAVSNATCIKMMKRNTTNENEPWVRFLKSKDGVASCYSEQVGFNCPYYNKRCAIHSHPAIVVVTPEECQNTKSDNYAGTIVHEIMHVLGFLHEFQRPDRDEYLRGIYDEAHKKYEGNTQNLTFDFTSITNYDGAGYGWRETFKSERSSNYTQPVGTLQNMGQECRLSKGDRNLVDRTYAKECKKNGHEPKVTHDTDYYIRGTNCNIKFHPKTNMDEMTEQMAVQG